MIVMTTRTTMTQTKDEGRIALIGAILETKKMMRRGGATISASAKRTVTHARDDIGTRTMRSRGERSRDG